jgi:hypothetical protein
MAELDNKSPFPAEIIPALGIQGEVYLVIILRGTFLAEQNGKPSPAALQEPVCLEDSYVGIPGKSSIKFASDFAISKSGTDVAMLGSAYAPGGRPTTMVGVELSVCPISKRVIVFGDRQWARHLGVPSISRPKPFVKMPLSFERAFGGVDTTHQDSSKHAWEQRNPIGAGFRKYKPIDGLALPNIEDPSNLISSPKDYPTPQGFGFIGRDWQPRRSFVGTYDDAWRKEQCPLLPIDFDYRYFQAAHPDLVTKSHLNGDEPVRITGAVPEGVLTFDLPGLAICVAVHRRRGRVLRGIAALDTVIVRPDEHCLNMVWRYTILCPRKIFDIERVVTFPLRLKTAWALMESGGNLR